VAKVAISEFSEYVRPDVSGCPEDIIERAVRDSMIEFCESTTIWRDDTLLLNTVVGLNTYELDVGREVFVMDVLNLFYLGEELKPTTAECLDKVSRAWRTTVGTPTKFVVIDHEVVQLDRLPSVATVAALTGTLICKPTRSATQVPSWLFENYVEAIAKGACSRLLKMKDKKWSNYEVGHQKYKEFLADVTDTKSFAEKGMLRKNNQRVNPRRIV
jgi:hypothetical protein